MNPNRILQIYQNMKLPEAQRWNLSLENLSIEYNLRKCLVESLDPTECPAIINIGIGAGDGMISSVTGLRIQEW